MRILLYVFTACYAYYTYKKAKRAGEWSWSRLFILLGSIALFFVCFMLPMMTSKLFDTRFNLMFGIMMAGIVAFTGVFVYLYRKPPARKVESPTQ
jgi:type VI protein secretion system component VasK